MKMLIGRRPGRTSWEIVVGPEQSKGAFKKVFNGMRFNRSNRTYAEVAVMVRDGGKKLSGGRPGQTPQQDSSSSSSSSSSLSSASSASSASSVNSSSSSSSSLNSSSSSSSSSNSSSSS